MSSCCMVTAPPIVNWRRRIKGAIHPWKRARGVAAHYERGVLKVELVTAGVTRAARYHRGVARAMSHAT